MSNTGNFFSLLLFLVGLSVIYAECYAKTGCREEEHYDKGKCNIYRQDYGAPVPSYTVSRTCGKRGPIVLEDITYVKVMAAYTREKIPERKVHAKGAGAYGYFEVTHDITDHTKAAVFSKVGQKTPLTCRLSPSFGESGRSETLRNRPGFACKFYTTDGNWDLVGQIFPVFFVRDPILYVSFIHIEGKNPITGRDDYNRTWDFFTKRQESLNAVLINYSDLGTPYSYRHVNGYGVNTFVFVNKQDKATYVKFTWTTDQGIRNYTEEEARKVAGEEPDWDSKDLYDNIESGNYPTWTFWVQLMSLEQAEHVKFDPLDATLLWPEHEFPLKRVGKLVLNKNPTNHFDDVEQSGYSVSALVPGIEPSLDRLLQGRMFAYDDAQRYRIGINSHQLPVNSPKGVKCCRHSISRDGFMNYYNEDGEPDYYPNSYASYHPDRKSEYRSYHIDGTVDRHDLGNQPNYEQAKEIYYKFSDKDKENLAKNIGNNIKNIKNRIQCKVVQMMKGVSKNLAAGIAHYGNVKNCQEQQYSNHNEETKEYASLSRY